MSSPTRLDAEALRQLLLRTTVSGEAGQQALTRLYQHYDPLIRAGLPKNLRPQDAEDLVQDVWAQVVAAIRRGRRLRRHEDVVALIAATLRDAAPSPVQLSAVNPQTTPPTPRRTFWQRILGFIKLLLPGQGAP